MFIRLYAKTASHWIFFQSRNGQTLAEYSLILAIVGLVVVSVLTAMGGQLKTIFPQVSIPLVASN